VPACASPGVDPDFSPGERVFKPARTFYFAITGL
jgi:hypothetical protein